MTILASMYAAAMLSGILRKLTNAHDGIALVTANFGGIDDIKPLPPHSGIDAFYYTDAETAASCSRDAASTWTRIIVPDYPRYDFNPRLRAKYFKIQIHRLCEVRRYRWLVWADGSVMFKRLDFWRQRADALARLPARRRILLVPHPERRTITEEFDYVEAEIRFGNEYMRSRYAQEKMPEQMAHFRRRGWDLNAKLWCGTTWMVENNDGVRRALDEWWDQNLRYGIMDQLSLPVALAEHGVEPQALDVHLWDNEYFKFIGHPASG